MSYIATRNGYVAATSSSADNIISMLAPNLSISERASYATALRSGGMVQVHTEEGTAFVTKVHNTQYSAPLGRMSSEDLANHLKFLGYVSLAMIVISILGNIFQ